MDASRNIHRAPTDSSTPGQIPANLGFSECRLPVHDNCISHAPADSPVYLQFL